MACNIYIRKKTGSGVGGSGGEGGLQVDAEAHGEIMIGSISLTKQPHLNLDHMTMSRLALAQELASGIFTGIKVVALQIAT